MIEGLSPKILRFTHLDSTNKKARELGKYRMTEGTVILAATQSAGRGSQGRSWYSPVGGLYMTAVLAAKGPEYLTDLSILAGAALAQTVHNLLPKSKVVSVKWPNDCLVDWKKVGGVLSEALTADSTPLCAVGIGLNVKQDQNALKDLQSGPFPATSLCLEGSDLDVEHVAQPLIKKLFSMYALYKKEGFLPIQQTWERNCRLIGKKVEIEETGRRAGSEDTFCGTFLGIDDSGSLVLSDPTGNRFAFKTGSTRGFSPQI